MNAIEIIFTILKPIFYPLSLLYGAIVWLRNKLYDIGLLSSVQFSVPVICVGNLSTGGTGKTPHIEYLIRLLQYEYQIATMSRGYKRKTQGFLLADEHTNAKQIGDEPMQFHVKFPEVSVSVCEDRMTGIPQLLGIQPQTDVILLDDAFQHRSVKPGLSIIITDYQKPYYKDFILPFGSLREARKASQRAQIIIVSKCPADIPEQEQQKIIQSLKPTAEQNVFFTKIVYNDFTDFFTGEKMGVLRNKNIVLVAGIAKPEPMMKYLTQMDNQIHLLRYADHHYFTHNNLEEIKAAYDNWNSDDKWIVTTEKDAARLHLHKETLQSWNINIAILPIAVEFIQDAEAFNDAVKNYIVEEKSANEDFFDYQ